MQLRKIYAVIIILLLCKCEFAKAQHPTQELAQVLTNIQAKYSGQTDLQFQVKYTYANESSPSKILDSTLADVEISGHKYYCHADSTEVFSNDSVTIVLFKEDKIMYLTRSRSAAPLYNPATMIDSLLKNYKGMQYTVTQNKAEKQVQIRFPQDLPYKTISFFINSKGYVSRIEYVVKTEELMEKGATSEDVKNYDAYALVKAYFKNYETSDMRMINFSPSSFYIKQGNELRTAREYEEYKIYLGSPDLH